MKELEHKVEEHKAEYEQSRAVREKEVQLWEVSRSKEIAELRTQQRVNDEKGSELERKREELRDKEINVQQRLVKFKVERKSCEQTLSSREERLNVWEEELEARERRVSDLGNQIKERNKVTVEQTVMRGDHDIRVEGIMSHTSSEEEERRRGAGRVRPRQEMEPKKFDGTIPWSAYHMYFKVCKEYNQWDDRDAALVLVNCCEGKAEAILSINEIDSREVTYRQLVELMQREFDRRDCPEIYFMELKNRRQNAGETSRQLGREISK
jgi:chromosome segregation ATPase